MVYFSLIIINLILFFSLNKISRMINIYDKPDGKLKIHNKRIPLLGGVLFFINLISLLLLQFFFLDDFLMFQDVLFSKREIISIIIFIVVFFIIGLFDDRYKVSPLTRLSFIIIFSIFLMSINQNLVVQNFTLSFYENRIFLNEFSIFFTIFCILILINALNFYDGINGQSGNLYILAFTFLYYVSGFNYFYLVLILVLVFILFLNYSNKIFFGDSGVYLISSIFIISLVYEYNVTKNIIYADEIFFLFLFPGLDLVRLTIERLFSNKNIFYGDRNHFHHYLIKKYSMLISNLLLVILNLLPMTLYYIGISFYYNLASFLIAYFIILVYLRRFKN